MLHEILSRATPLKTEPSKLESEGKASTCPKPAFWTIGTTDFCLLFSQHVSNEPTRDRWIAKEQRVKQPRAKDTPLCGKNTFRKKMQR